MLDRRAPCVGFPSRVGSLPAPPTGASGRTAHPARPALRAPSSPAAHHRARPSARARAQRAGVVGEVQVPKLPKGEASGEVVRVGGRRAWEPFQGSHIRLLPVDRLRLTVLCLTLLFWAVPVHAATVAIVRPPNPSPDLTETLSRLHGELLSVGLEVEIADGPAVSGLGTTDWRVWLEELVAERGVDAVIDIVGDVVPVAVEVWLVDKASRRLEVARVALEPNTENPSERLAIRAIEVLRSSFLEIDLAARGRRGEAVAKPSTTRLSFAEVNQPVSQPGRFGVEVGAAALTSLDGVGPAILPLLRFDWAVRSRLVAQAVLAGLGSRPTVATTAGNARVAQQYGVLGGCYRFRSDQWLQPFVALAAGVLRTSVEGQANSPKQGHSADQWSFLLDGSLGAGLRLRGRYFVTLAAHVHVAEPYVAIHFVDEVVATSGSPNLLLTFTVGAWL